MSTQAEHPDACYNFLYGFKGTPSGRANRAEARAVSGRAGTRSHRGRMRKPAGPDKRREPGGVAGATVRLWGRQPAPPFRLGSLRAGHCRHGRPAPHPSTGGPRRYAPAMTRAGEHQARAVLHAPGILSPGKPTLKGAPCGRVLRTALRAALDRELPRQDLGT